VAELNSIDVTMTASGDTREVQLLCPTRGNLSRMGIGPCSPRAPAISPASSARRLSMRIGARGPSQRAVILPLPTWTIIVPPQPSQIGARPVSTCAWLSGRCARHRGQTIVYWVLSATTVHPRVVGIPRHRPKLRSDGPEHERPSITKGIPSAGNIFARVAVTSSALP